MLSIALPPFCAQISSDATGAKPRPRPSTLVFISDTVQPWGAETLLLAVLRRDAAEQDQPFE
ncbi:hypothetical protein [uncultured Roseobacter sp.]|uniref:hypothetical protein n=1 Tax=uncultured Roseobacter sp. TaxID=114847 RepID=UPI0026377077|nr:hypothetical protein [uncultured Roseobacter sp.]